MKKILWLDDDINTGALRAFVDEFADNHIEIQKVNSPDSFLQIIKDNITFDLLIMDVMMPTGEILTSAETKSGLHTGFKLLKNYLAQGTSTKIVIFTILFDEKVRRWAQDNDIPYLLKRDETPETFFKYIMSVDHK